MYNRIISLYSGKLDAPTGVASVIKQLDKGEWQLFDKVHQVFTLDFKDSEPVEPISRISNSVTRISRTQAIRNQITIIASNFRKRLWDFSEDYYFFACFYIYFFHQIRAHNLVNDFMNDMKLVNSGLIVHDMWTLLALYESGYDLNKVVFVVHGSSSPVDFLENIFPSLIGTSTTSKLRASLISAISKVRSVVVLSESSLEKVRLQLGSHCEVIYNGLESIASVSEVKPNGLIHIYLTGNVCKRKRQYLIPKILNNLNPKVLNRVEVHVFGGGFTEPIRTELSLLGVSEKVKFWGNTSNPSAHYRTGDIILCISSEEGLPMALIEGIRSGCIPVTVDIGGCREVVCERGGFIMGSLNDIDVIEETSRIIEEIVLNTDINFYACNSMEHFKNKFSNHTMVKKYAQLF